MDVKCGIHSNACLKTRDNFHFVWLDQNSKQSRRNGVYWSAFYFDVGSAEWQRARFGPASYMPLGVFLPDVDGQPHAGLKGCHMNQVQSLQRWKHAWCRWQGRPKEKSARVNWTSGGRGFAGNRKSNKDSKVTESVVPPCLPCLHGGTC